MSLGAGSELAAHGLKLLHAHAVFLQTRIKPITSRLTSDPTSLYHEGCPYFTFIDMVDIKRLYVP